MRFNFENHAMICKKFDEYIVDQIKQNSTFIMEIFEQLIYPSGFNIFKGLLSMLFEKVWINRESDANKEMEFAIEWPHFVEIYKCLNNPKSNNLILEEKWYRRVQEVMNTVKSSLDKIMNGNVSNHVIFSFS